MFSFAPEKFNKLFPFYLLLNDKGYILSIGESIAKLCTLTPGQSLYDVFTLKRPTLEVANVDLVHLNDELIVLECKVNPRISLRGQFENTTSGNTVFVGTPWFGTMDQVVENKLSIRDFALHDPLIDLLHVLKSQEITTNEIKELLLKVNHQKNTLIESERRISSLVLNLQTGILLEDQHRHIILCNRMFCDLFKIPVAPELLAGVDCSNAAEETKWMFKDADRFVTRIETILRDRQIVLSEKMELVDGRIFERDYMPIFVSNEYKGHLWKYTDITDRESVNRKLQQQEEKYRSIIDNMKLGLLEVTLEDEIQFVNKTFCDISGYTPEELVGKKAHAIFDSTEFTVMAEVQKALRKRGISDGYEFSMIDKEGRKRQLYINGSPNYDASGELIGSIDVILEITEQKALEDELRIAKNRAEESSRAKESFLANMSHEIRTPLNGIIGMTRELAKTALNPKQQLYLKHTASASQHLLSIINNILDISKIEAGEFNLEQQPFDLRSVIAETKSILASAAADKNLFLVLRNTERLAPAYIGDPHRIRQVLLNIMGNAVKFTEKGGITLSCEMDEYKPGIQEVHLIIEDTGIGIEKSFLTNFFKKFSQEDASTARKYGGTGLGMAITHELIKMMKGTIKVTSEKGVGTRFDIYVPLKVASSTNEGVSSENKVAISEKDIRILLVEDNEMNRLVAINTLSLVSNQIEEAENGSIAIEKLKEKQFDLVLMDLQMPVLGGMEATQVIRKDLNLEVPIIALTANAFKNEIDKCLQVGMNDYVTKPFDEGQLLQIVQKYTTTKKSNGPSTGLTEPVHHPASGKLYDLTSLKAMSQNNSDFIQKMIDLFCKDMPIYCQELSLACDQRDLVTLKAIAHKIKPVLHHLGIGLLKEDIMWLEKVDPAQSEYNLIAMKVRNVVELLQRVVHDLHKEKLMN